MKANRIYQLTDGPIGMFASVAINHTKFEANLSIHEPRQTALHMSLINADNPLIRQRKRTQKGLILLVELTRIERATS